MSGRTLRRLPAISLVLYTNGVFCGVDEALVALRRGVEEEAKAKAEARNEM